MGDIKIVDSIEKSTMASTWIEHLCLHRIPEGKWCLDIRSFEVVGFAIDFEDEEGELPDEINGHAVVGTEDDLVVVNNLILQSDDYRVYLFVKFDAKDFDELFGVENAEWCNDETKRKIREAILNYAG
jgi:hypothetical protein